MAVWMAKRGARIRRPPQLRDCKNLTSLVRDGLLAMVRAWG